MTTCSRASTPFDELPGAVADAASSAGETLLTGRAVGQLLELARVVPAVTQSFGFECRLAAEDDRVDLGVAVSPANGGRDALARLGAAEEAWSTLERDERWLRIGRFARAWSEVGQPLRSWASFVFLEFDEESALDPIPVPSIFVGLDSPLEGTTASSPELRAAQHGVSLLAGGSDANARSARLARAFSVLPEGARILHVGVMLGRVEESLRVSAWLPGSEAAGYLRRLDAHGAAEIAEGVHKKLAGLFTPAQLDFDLDPGAGERIGFGLRPSSPGQSAWAELLEELAKALTFSRAKCDALLSWPGVSSRSEPDGSAWLMRREISHVKLACARGAAPQLKAYLGVTPQRVT